MREYIQELKDFFRKGDVFLLVLCLIATAFGCLVIASTTNTMGSARYIIVQIGACILGVLFFIIISSIDADFLSEHRAQLTLFNCALLLLLVPFGTDNGTGNKSWLNFSFLPIDIQPAEVCKITYVVILASVMNSHKNRINSVPSIFHIAVHALLLIGLNMAVSRDAGVSLIFVFIFAGMVLAGGVSWAWIAAGIGAIAVMFPILWSFLDGYQRNRIEVLFNPDLDPTGIGVRYHTVRSLRSLTGGGLTGQGLFQGHRTQSAGALYAQHTDYIFSAIGEELGYFGCAFVILLLFAIVIRCIWVGVRSQDYMRRLICFGTAAALSFQIISNVGMCIGVTPVIGLTLPFISYGGSSLVSLYAMLGLVSGVYARPAPASHERYIRPPR